MPIEITIPRLGWSMEEGNFVNWLKKNGELVKSGDLLFTLENEKATQDIEATDSGILHIPKEGPQPGQVVRVGQVIGHLLKENELAEAALVTGSPAKSGPGEKKELGIPSEVGSRSSFPTNNADFKGAANRAISPRARRLAAQLGLDASRLRGSGRTGRIIEKDVRESVKNAQLQGLSKMRSTIAQRTSASFSSTPHFYLRSEVDATALIRLREELLPEIQKKNGVRLTLTDLLLRAQARALNAFPDANAIWLDNDIVKLPTCDVGLVVGLPGGIIIPIVRSPEAGDLAALAQQRCSLVELARSGKLTREAQQGGATALSNLGNTRVDEFAAVIAPLQSSMLAVGRAGPRPIVVDGQVAVRTTLRLCLSVDHRVLDGAPAAEFLGQIIEFLEHPEQLTRDHLWESWRIS